MREDFITIAAFEGEGQLGGEEAVAHADVVTAALEFGGEIAFASDELGEGGAELDGILSGGG